MDRLLAKLTGKKHLHNRVRSNLTRLFYQGMRWGCCDSNPAFKSVRLTEEPRTRLLGEDEMDRLLDALEKKPGQSADV